MGSQVAQRGEDTDVVLVVRAQLKAVALGNDQRQFKDINRIEAQPVAEKRGVGVDLAGAQGLLVTITTQRSLKMREINEVMNLVRAASREGTPIVFGTSSDEDMGDGLRVTLVATGYVGGGQA